MVIKVDGPYLTKVDSREKEGRKGEGELSGVSCSLWFLLKCFLRWGTDGEANKLGMVVDGGNKMFSS